MKVEKIGDLFEPFKIEIETQWECDSLLDILGTARKSPNLWSDEQQEFINLLLNLIMKNT